MRPVITQFQKSFSIIIIPVGFVLFFVYGFTFLSTVIGWDNFYGKLYKEYHVSPISFSIYNLLVAFIAGVLTVRLIKGVLNKKQTYVKRSLWIFLAMSVILICGEIVLHF
jgi:biotin transporter BioY